MDEQEGHDFVTMYRYSCKLKKCKKKHGEWETSRGAAEQQRDAHIRVYHPGKIRLVRASFKLEKM